MLVSYNGNSHNSILLHSTKTYKLKPSWLVYKGIFGDQDKGRYIWNSGDYSSQKAYLQTIGINDASPIFQWMWKSCVMDKHKFFFWLLLRDRLNTRGLLRRKKWTFNITLVCSVIPKLRKAYCTYFLNAHLACGVGGLWMSNKMQTCPLKTCWFQEEDNSTIFFPEKSLW
jgi:hypothetical protein